MHNLQLYINDQLVDLSDDNPIALTFQINNLADVKNQQGNTSNQFKLPLTQNNRRILGFPDDIAFCTDAPYKQYPARVIQDGLEIIPYGVAELNSLEQDTANITVLSGNVDFFDAIDAKIYDMGDSTTKTGAAKPFKNFSHTWTLDNIVNSQSKTDGWIWPVVDYGKIGDLNSNIDVRYLRPGFFLKTAISTIAGNAGFKATGSLLNDPLYNKLIVQFANDNFQHSTDVQNSLDIYSVTALSGERDQYCSPAGNRDGAISFTDIKQGSPLSFDGTVYTALEDMNVNLDLTYSIKVRGTKKGDIMVRISIRHDRLGDLAPNDHPGEKSDTFKIYEKQKITLDLELHKNDRFRVYYWLESKQTEAYFMGGSLLTITNKRGDVLYKQSIECERIFPDINQKDLLKDTLQRFGVICQTDNTTKTVNFALFSDILNNISFAKDWSKKCLDQGKSISFQLGGYTQVNYMKYKADDNVLPAGLADSQIRVDDTTLPATGDLFESQFAPSLNRPWQRGNIAVINKIDPNDQASTDFSVSTQPRILIDEKRTGINVTFTDGTSQRILNAADQVSTPYFDKPGGEYSLSYESLRLKYYPELERILKNTKKVVRYFLLTPRDILELDLLIPVYLQQDSAYYYINKIDSWRKGQSTKVELIKLG